MLYQAKCLGWVAIRLSRLLLYVGFLMVLIGYAQYFFMPDARWLATYGWDDHYYRMIGSLLEPGFLSLLFVLTGLHLLPLDNQKKSIGYLLVSVALLLTYARSGYVAYLVVTLGYFWRKGQLMRGVAMSLLFCLSILLLPQPGGEGVNLTRTYSVVSRAKSTVTALEIFGNNPLLGVGFNAYPEYALDHTSSRLSPIRHPSSPDNSYVFVLATAGLVGLVGFLYFLWSCLQISKHSPSIYFSLVAIFVHSFTNNSFFYSWVLLWMFLLVVEADYTAISRDT